MIDLQIESPVSLKEIAAYCHASFPTVWRWALKGLPGPDGKRVRLECCRLGGKWVSSFAALQRFSEATTPTIEGVPAPSPRSPGKRERAAARAERELLGLGI